MQGIRGWQEWTIGCAMFHPNGNSTADDVIDCLRAIVGLFGHLLKKADFLDVGYMWWDIGYGACQSSYRYAPDYKPKFPEEEMSRISHAGFETMVAVLSMQSLDCQKAAIHGLGHSRYAKKDEILQKYIDDHPDHPAWIIEYARNAIEGKVL